MGSRLIFVPLRFIFLTLFLVIAGFVISLLFFGLVNVAFLKLGFNWRHAMMILFATLVGSVINIPIKTIESERPVVAMSYKRIFGNPNKVPIFDVKDIKTVVAANVGGAIIPSMISFYLLFRIPSQLEYAIIGIFTVSLITHILAKPVRGLGITVPAFVPPVTAAVCAITMKYIFGLPQGSVFVIAYVSGVLGTLIGADLTNLGLIGQLGAPVASIGGAGTFDGVFLAGVIAVLLS
ncbi:MAG: DUF1614 domain-containing protein [Halobacteriota archaeon]|nr:DUF1614 domain-containing protein [Halobacteriota archaeon]